MSQVGRIVTAKLPNDLVSRLDEIADRIDRSKSWIVRQAVTEWLAEEQRRYGLTLRAMESVEEGQALTEEEVKRQLATRRSVRSRAREGYGRHLDRDGDGVGCE